jgi:glutamyl-Q tRNA(Asp) synthetase
VVAALACACDAMAHGGSWMLRIEDVDPPRERPGAAQHIIATLAALGFKWHGEILYQSQRTARYQEALDDLATRELAYRCCCTRVEVVRNAKARTRDREPIYAGTCALGTAPGRQARSWRMRMPDTITRFTDRLMGEQKENTARETGDVVIKRADGYWAYQLAVVVDDMDAGITDVVRGDDLLNNTARQIVLMNALAGVAPRYLHVPVLRNAQGEKLSKQTHALPVDTTRPLASLMQAASHLGLHVDAGSVSKFWLEAPKAWEATIRGQCSDVLE